MSGSGSMGEVEENTMTHNDNNDSDIRMRNGASDVRLEIWRDIGNDGWEFEEIFDLTDHDRQLLRDLMNYMRNISIAPSDWHEWRLQWQDDPDPLIDRFLKERNNP